MFVDLLVVAAAVYTIGAIPLTIAFDELLRQGRLVMVYNVRKSCVHVSYIFCACYAHA